MDIDLFVWVSKNMHF